VRASRGPHCCCIQRWGEEAGGKWGELGVSVLLVRARELSASKSNQYVCPMVLCAVMTVLIGEIFW